MRLDRLKIDGFKNLNNVEIDFDEDELSTVLIGINGTGKSNVLEAQTRYYSGVIKPGAEKEVDPREPRLRRLFYARPFYGQLALLTSFALLEEDARDFLRRHMQIVGFHSALLVLKRPDWARSKPSEIFRRHGDPRFWYATGVVRHLLSALWDHALAPLQITETVQDDYREKSRSEEHIYVFIKDEEALRAIAKPFGSEQAFFALLETLDISDLVREVRVWVQREGSADELPFHEISDGEKQLLTVLGLIRFTGHQESLFLLDEPDTHLNPTWKRDYLELIEVVAGKNADSHLVMTTHDPLTISGLVAKQVQVLSRDEEGRVWASRPVIDPRGLGVAGILTDVFGLESSLDLATQEKLDARNQLFAVPESERTAEQESELQKLTNELANLGFRQASREPLYARFPSEVGTAQSQPAASVHAGGDRGPQCHHR